MSRTLTALALLTMTTVAFANDAPDLITDRPDATESAAVVDPGHGQIEAGWTITRNDDDGVETDTLEIPATLARIGLADRWELRVGWGGFVNEEVEVGGVKTDDVDGPADADLGAKVRFWDEKGGRPELALLFGASLPTGDSQLTSDRVDPAFRFSAAHTLTERIGLGYNVGMEWSTEADAMGERDTLSSFIYTVATGFGITDRFGAFVEAFGELGGSAGGCPSHSLDGGVTYLLRPNLQLDFAGGFGLSDAADDLFLGVGVSARFPD